MELVILAAGKGSRIFKSIHRNKCLIKLNTKTLIEKIIIDAKSLNKFNKIHVVVGYKKSNIINQLKNMNVNFIDNKEFDKKEMLHTLKLGLQKCKEDTIISYSDIIYPKKVFKDIFKIKNKHYLLPILKNWKSVWKQRKKAIIDDCETLDFDKNFILKDIGEKLDHKIKPKGQFMGIFFIPKNKIKKSINLMNKNNNKMHTTGFINHLIKQKEKIRCIVKNYKWYEFDDIDDLKSYKKNLR